MKNQKIKTEYRVTFAKSNAFLDPSGYSKFNLRWKQYAELELEEGEQVYGLEQAREHAQEYFSRDNEYNAQRRAEAITIKKIVTIEEDFASVNWVEAKGVIYQRNLDPSKIENINILGIDFKDAPDFCDAYIESADYDGQPMTDEEIESLDSEFVYEQVMKQIYYQTNLLTL
jgi:hypothetical protein